MASTSGTTTTSNGLGTFSDLLTGFAAEATKLPTGPTPDVNVSVAYALGWAVGDALICAQYGVFEHLLKVPGLPAGAGQWNLLVNRIINRCGQLDNHLKSASDTPDLSDQLKAAAGLRLDSNPGDIKATLHDKDGAVEQLHTGILAVLWSVEPALGKSYLLGHEMEQMCAIPVAGKSAARKSAAEESAMVKASVKTYFARIHRLLTALASKLPSNAAHATDNSLRLWSASLAAGGDETPEDLLHQGWRWREVLAGDVAGKDGLRLTDYVAAADSVAGKLWQTARQVAARFAVLLIIALIVAAGGIVLIILGTTGTIGAGIAGLVAAFGLTWKGIGDFFGRAAAKAEEELWNAEIDWAIAYRFTTLCHPPANKQLRGRSNAGNLDQPTKEHLRRYSQWKKKWPDVLPAINEQSQAVTIPPTIAEGATGPTVRWAQYLLVRRTLSDAQIDGIFGPVTKAAVEQFQGQVKITVDGIVGPVTWGKLGGDGPEPPTLAKGSEGSLVRRLQTVLNEGRGEFVPSSEPVLTVDGIYGPITAGVVEGAQRLGGIEVDGVVGLQTWALPVHAAGQVLADLCGVPGPGGS